MRLSLAIASFVALIVHGIVFYDQFFHRWERYQTAYFDQARSARAAADLRTLADAIRMYNRDTGRWPIYATAKAYKNDNAASAQIGTATGDIPDKGKGKGWTANVDSKALESFLDNDYSAVGNAPFPKAGFRGPYVGTVDSDPWGNKYLLNANDLTQSSDKHAYLISAGPNGTLETERDVAMTAPVTVGGDDIVTVIR